MATDPSTLRILTRDRTWLDRMAPSLVHPIAGTLYCVLAFEHPDSFQIATPGDLEQLGLAAPDAHAVATENTRKFLPPEAEVCHRLEPGQIGTLQGGTLFESSRLCDHQGWAELAETTEGDLLVATPDMGLVLYGDSGFEGASLVIHTIAARIHAGSKASLSPQVLRWDVDGWLPAAIPQGFDEVQKREGRGDGTN